MAELNQLEIIVEQEQGELLAAFLALRVVQGWAEETLPTGEILCRVHSDNPEFCAELSAELAQNFPTAELRRGKVENVDWLSAWKDFFTPVEGGKLFMVLAPWMKAEKAAALAEGRKVITIEPKNAFGTGHHATTALCLKAISDLAEQGEIKPGMRFFDLGTGSGILGLGAALLGLKGLGLDIDLPSVENALENREINRVEAANFPIRRGSLADLDAAAGEREPYDLVLANILADPLKDMAAELALLVRKGGKLVLAGLLNIQANGVEQAYMAAGMPKAERYVNDEWTALIFRP